MTELKIGMIVKRLATGNYNLSKTNYILASRFLNQTYANTTKSIGDAKVEWVDHEGALVSYEQDGWKTRGWLYYYNKDLEIIKSSKEEIINNYQIY